MNILLVGSTGAIGKEVLKLALKHPSIAQVRILVRRSIEQQDRKLLVQVIDFEALSNTHLPLFEGIDAVFCCLGTTIKQAGSQANFRKVDFDYVVRTAQLAKQAKVPHFLVVSAMGADAQSSIFYNRVKGDMEQALKQLNFPKLSIFRPSLLLAERQEFRLGERIASAIMPLFSWIMVGRMANYRPIKTQRVAQAMLVKALEQKNTSTEHVVYLSNQIQELSNEFSL